MTDEWLVAKRNDIQIALDAAIGADAGEGHYLLPDFDGREPSLDGYTPQFVALVRKAARAALASRATIALIAEWHALVPPQSGPLMRYVRDLAREP
jgi:hypothetical protein